jgi:hypothetical protein
MTSAPEPRTANDLALAMVMGTLEYLQTQTTMRPRHAVALARSSVAMALRMSFIRSAWRPTA